MPHTGTRAGDDRGFTLIELLVAILIIGILAAIALPTFLVQREKAQDSVAKSNARNLVSHVESCSVEAQSYVGCDAALTSANTGLSLVTGGAAGAAGVAAGKVAVITPSLSSTAYTVVAKSANGRVFQIAHTATGNARTCANSGGGCANSTW